MPGYTMAENVCVRGCCSSDLIDLRVSKADLRLVEGSALAIAQGGTSRVLEGEYRGQPVAVKLPGLAKTDDLDRFHKELQMMQRVNHPHVIPLLACKAHPPDYCFVMPLAHRNVAQAVHEQAWGPSWHKIVRLGLQIAGGVAHLHDLNLVHRDLKPANILMNATSDHVWLTDLGIAMDEEALINSVDANSGNIKWVGRGKPSGGFHKQVLAGTLEYMAPEVLQKRPSSKASDVFAFGVVLNEIATGIVPYSDCTKDNPGCHTVLEMGYGRQELAAAVAGDGLRPLPADDTPPVLQALLDQCWLLEPGQRPTMQQVQAQLEAVLEELGPEPVSQPVTAAPAEATPMQLDGTGDGTEEGASGTVIELPVPQWGAPVSQFPLKVRIAPFATAGRRGADRMEDRHLVLQNLGGVEGAHLVAVFDGHRGAQAAQYCEERLARQLAEAWGGQTSLSATLIAAFEATDAAFVAHERRERQRLLESGVRVPSGHAGCTAIAAILYGTTLTVANAGDCRALLCRAGQPVQLTRDHSAECEEERARVVAAGGKVELKDSWRIGKAAIQVTRSIGDADVKADGLTAIPEVFTCELTPEDEFLVVACDGLWDTLSNDKVVGIVQDTVKHPAMVAQRLATEAINAGSGDNISVVVVFLQPSQHTLERVY